MTPTIPQIGAIQKLNRAMTPQPVIPGSPMPAYPGRYGAASVTPVGFFPPGGPSSSAYSGLSSRLLADDAAPGGPMSSEMAAFLLAVTLGGLYFLAYKFPTGGR